MPSLRIKRGTRAQVTSAGAASGLKQGELYHVTDEDRVDLGTGLTTSVSMAKKSEVDAKEPTITAGTASQYWRGNKTWADFFTDVRAATLTGLSTATNAVITATDTVLSALGKLQKQVSDNLSTLTSHTSNTSNPHSTTKAQVGLGNVDNTSDADKPVSAATQTALNAKQDTLVSATNIKTLNGTTLLGAGNIVIDASVTLNEAVTNQGLADPNADRILFWDDSASTHTYLTAGTGLTISGTTMTPRAASTAQTGIVQLNDTISSTSTTLAATANAVKTAYDLAGTKLNTANPASTGTATHTGTGTATSGFVTSDNVAFTVQPSAAGSTALYTAKFGTLTYSGSHAMAFPAHAIGTFGKVIWSPSANVQADLLLGAEGTIEVTAGSVLLAYGVVGTINAVSAGRTIAEAAGLYGKCTANSGTITSFWIAKGEIPGNSGTIGQHGGYYIPDCSGVSGITTRVGFVNDDPAAPNISDSPSYGPIGQASKQEIAPMPHPGYVAGRYYTPLDHATPTPVGLSANLMYLVPFAVAQRTTFTRIGIKCTTAQAATNARLGIYRAIDGVPSNLVLDAGAVSLATTGDKEITISQQFEAGDYFLAVLSNATTAQITWSLVNIAMRVWRYGLVGSDTADGAADLLMIAGFTYGALPATCPAVTFVGSTAVEPRIWLRKL